MPDDVTPEEQTSEGQAAETPKTFDADYVKGLRDEAAGWRTKLRDAEKQLQALAAEADKRKTAELEANKEFEALAGQYKAELEALRGEVKSRDLALLRTRIGTELGLPTALAERLTGEDEDSIRADAEKIRALMPTPAQPSATTAGATTAKPAGSPQGKSREQMLKELYGGGNVFGSAPATSAETEEPRIFRRGG